MEQIFGYIERIVFHNSDNGFTVARLKQPRKSDLTTIVGPLPGIQAGESVRCQGDWKHTSSHGTQFEVITCDLEAPADIVGIKKYLASGLVRGIGPIYAERIVDAFGLETLKVIDETPERLSSIAGIGKKRLASIITHWQEHKAIREVMLFLQKYGVSPVYAQKIYKTYGDKSIEYLQEDPYQIAHHIPGVGFKKADGIAETMGFAKDSKQRIDAGILYVLSELSGEGHVCYPQEDFLQKTEEMLGVSTEDISERISTLVEAGTLMREEGLVWSKGLYLCEQGIAREIERLQSHPCALRAVDREKAVTWVEEELALTLASNQKEAVSASLHDKLHIITGGPGTGKSTITRAILTITEKLSRQIILAAPTGRAAKRMTEITGKPAYTIHSLLGYDFKTRGFRRNRDNPFPCDLIIIDEASMIDTSLMYNLLKAIPSHARVLLIGDIHQLPSVGPGNVLKDLIESDCVPVTTLTEIFRQAAGSRIITNAHKINAGIFPDLSFDKESDFFFLRAEEPPDVIREISTLVSKRLPRYYHLHPIRDIQVLAPMKRGPIGTENLNHVLQELLNPQDECLFQAGRRFAKGDKVMQIRNNYNKEVFNGDIGRVIGIHKEDQSLTVSYEGRTVPYSLFDLDELVLAYATSIHKYQGSECPCVVIPVHTSHFVMLHRNLLYTGVTRGKRLVVLVGTGKAIAIATSTDDVKKRFTHLTAFLKHCYLANNML